MRRLGPLSNGNRFSGRVMMAICRASAPNWWNAALSSSALSNEKEIERWVLVGTHPADGATKKFESIKTLSVNVEIGRRNDGQWCSEFRLFGLTLPCRTTANLVQELPRLQERQHQVRWRFWNRAGRHEVCLLACCAGVHVDFHTDRHFNDLRCFPGH